MKTQIAIRGRRYTVRSDEDGVDLQQVARYVETKMNEVSPRPGTLDDYTVALLACLNIASDFERYRRQVDEELAVLDREVASTSVMIEAALPGASVDGES